VDARESDAYVDEPHRIAEESSPVARKESRERTASTAGQRVRGLVPHGPLTTTTRWRSSFILLIPLLVLFVRHRAASSLRASRASAASYTGPPRRWRWLIVAPLSRDNEISVYAMRSPAGAALSLSLSLFLSLLAPIRSTFPVSMSDRRFAFTEARSVRY